MNRRWLRAARICALFTVLVMVVPITIIGIIQSLSEGLQTLLISAVMAPFCAPHLWTFLRLSGKTESSIRRGLALAVSFGSFSPVLILGYLLGYPRGASSWEYAVPILLGLLQVALVVTAINAYHTMRREPRDHRILLVRFAVGFSHFVLILAAMALPNLVVSRQSANKASAVGSLRTLNTAHESYAEQYPDKGFARALTDLAPPQNNFIGPQLGSGQKSHFLFTLAAASPDSHRHISAYTITACPQFFPSDGSRCFFTDQTRVIRYTTGNRAPTAQDPPLD